MEKIIILGAGESGVGAAILAQKLGYELLVSDAGSIKEQYIQELSSRNIPFEQGQHSEELILNTANLVIKSPGIPYEADLIQKLQQKGVEIIDEMEFAYRNMGDSQLIAITGSNGKTTTTLLTHHLLKTAGLDAALVGNVGFSFAKQVAEAPAKYYVAEVSSFQLDGCSQFSPDIAILLNITPDHLDRYGYEMDNYIQSKLKIAQNKPKDGYFIHNSSSPAVQRGLELFYRKDQNKLIGLSETHIAELGEMLRVEHSDFNIEKSALSLSGKHNYFNISAAVHAALALGISHEQIKAGLGSFKNEAHRLEFVCNINGVDYINDSKATNVDSVWYALDAMQKPTVWIVGGVDKGNDYQVLDELVKQKVRAIICLGKDNSKIRAAFEHKHPIIEETASIGEAIKVASLYAEVGDVVLLSPACASFDLFKNYIDRGNQFKNLLLEQARILKEGVKITLQIPIQMNPAEHKADQ